MMFRYLFYLIIFLSPVLNKSTKKISPPKLVVENTKEEKPDIYTDLNLAQYGLSLEAFQHALTGYQVLNEKQQLRNPDILTIVDFSQSSKNKRLYVLDLKEQKLLFNTWVSHGRNTGDEFAENFSNTDGSWQSSLGFYITENTHVGAKVGFSLILEGVEKGINDNAKNRQIIMHGADYATEDFINQTGRLGRSFGCPAVPPQMIEPIVDSIRDGSLLFLYYPDENYLNNSELLSV